MTRKNIHRLVVGIFLIIGSISYTFSQTVSGTVSDKSTGETLIGATVLDLVSGKGTITNTHGRYSLTLPQDSAHIRISYIGYTPEQFPLRLGDTSVELNVQLIPSIELKTVTIRAERPTDPKSSQISAIAVPVEHLKSVPVIFGETDVLKTLQLMPGVQSGSEGMSGMYVRGGGPDQNLFLLDGVPIYNVNHLGGFFSAFNADAVKNVTLYKGSFPAHFSGRLSSVLDITTNNGNDKEYHGNLSIGAISAKFSLEGPIIKEKTTFSISGRRTYADALIQPALLLISTTDGVKTNAGYYFYDLNAKITHKFSEKSRLYASYYMGDDAIYAKFRYTYLTDNDYMKLNVQLVPADKVQGNDYNPNHVAPPEMKLLKLSIKKDGVTMPVVVCDTPEDKRHPYTVVDGFHRTTVIQTDKTVRESLHGYVPVSRLNKSIEDRITATVRHNMARGTHQVELSAKLIVLLKKHNWTNARIGMELGMDADEVLRLKQITGIAEAFKDQEFSKSWEPVYEDEVLTNNDNDL